MCDCNMLAEFFLNMACILALFLGLAAGFPRRDHTCCCCCQWKMSIFQFLDCCHKLTGKYCEPSLGHWQASCKDMNKVVLWWLFCISITSLSVKLKLARFITNGIFSITCIDFPSVGRVLYVFHAQAFHLMEASCQWKHVNSTWIVTWFVDKTRQNCAWRNKNISKN